jgi:hypothetical protein
LIDIDLPDHDGIDDEQGRDNFASFDQAPLSLNSSDEDMQTLRKELAQIRDLLSEPH